MVCVVAVAADAVGVLPDTVLSAGAGSVAGVVATFVAASSLVAGCSVWSAAVTVVSWTESALGDGLAVPFGVAGATLPVSGAVVDMFDGSSDDCVCVAVCGDVVAAACAVWLVDSPRDASVNITVLNSRSRHLPSIMLKPNLSFCVQ